MSFWNLGSDCLRCNNKGVIPVLEAKQQGKRLIPIEIVYTCDCEKSHELSTYVDKSYTDDLGKRKKTRVKKLISTNFDEAFDSFQFKWNDEIMRSRNPYIDYHEVYIASSRLTIMTMNQTGVFKPVTDFDYLENQKGLGFSKILSNFKIQMRELVGK